MAIWVAVFFVLASLIAWFVLFPSARDGAATGAGRISRLLTAIGQRWRRRAAAQASDSSQAVRGAGGRLWRTLAQHRYAVLATLVLLGLPPTLVLLTRQQVALDGFESTQLEVTNPQILELLRGERLVPPPDLPPEVFVVAEAELIRMGPAAVVVPEKIVSADRRWDRIDTDFQQRVLVVYKLMREQYGYEMRLVEGYRSPERQAELARGGKATRAGAGQSCHQYGLAVDSAVFRDGKLQWDMGDAWVKRGYFLYGELAEQAGLEWGGNWRSIKDYVHLEMKDRCRTARRMAGR